MMIKDEAIRLYNFFWDIIPSGDYYNQDDRVKECCRKCIRTVTDEIKKFNTHDVRLIYWENVKEEINKL